MADNKLYYGDNLDVLRRHVKDESVDLVYLDPPFNSNADYNVLFAQKDGTGAAAQIQAFEDTWGWDMAAARALDEMVHAGDAAGDALLALQRLLGQSDMMAYLAMMAPRVVELRRVLKSTGSLYLHCDPTASHYLKVLLDAVFGPEQFLNDVSWKRTTSHGNVGRNFGSLLDHLLVYVKGPTYKWNQQYAPYPPEYVAAKFRNQDADGRRWQSVTLRNPGVRPNLRFPYTASNGVTYQPHPNGWACDSERLEKYDREGRLHFPAKAGGQLRLKTYLDERPGIKLQNLWTDIPAINSQAGERLGYPTQKPVALLERIVEVNTDAGDIVLDPFCGCGTTIAAAHKLRRRWIGIDITHLAVNLMKHRLQNAFGPSVAKEYDVIGEPTTAEGAWELAQSDPYQFQFWALGLVGARPHEEKKGADKGIDGRLHFLDPETGTYQDIVISVKAGKPHVWHLRDLRGVVDREKAAIGVLIVMEEPTRPMVKEAATGAFYNSPFGQHPGLQILTIQELLTGARIDYPRQADVTIKKAPRQYRRDSHQLSLADEEQG